MILAAMLATGLAAAADAPPTADRPILGIGARHGHGVIHLVGGPNRAAPLRGLTLYLAPWGDVSAIAHWSGEQATLAQVETCAPAAPQTEATLDAWLTARVQHWYGGGGGGS